MSEKTKVIAKKAFEILVFVFAVCLLINRVLYGIEFTDESWYVAEAYAVANLGLHPFVDLIHQTPGFVLPLALAFKLFVAISGSTEGIVLFSRLLYVVVASLIILLSIYLVNKYSQMRIPYIFAAAILVGANDGSLFDLDYYTFGILYFPLILAVIFAGYNSESYKDRSRGIIAGIIAVRAVIATPNVLIGLVIVFAFLCIKKKNKLIQGILIGCAGTTLLIVLYTVIVGGLGAFPNWVKLYFSQGYFDIERRDSWELNKYYLKRLFVPAAFAFAGLSVLKLILKKKDRLFGLLVRLSVIASTFFGLLISLKKQDTYGFYLACFTWFLPFICALFLMKKGSARMEITIACFSIFSIFMFASASNVYGFGPGRAYWFNVPMCLALAIVMDYRRDSEALMVSDRFLTAMACVACIGIILFKLWGDYAYVYRDEPVRQLNSKVEAGIWKGLYTTAERASSVVEMEKAVREMTADGENILFLDQVSFGYLMIDSNICAPSTADASAYSYRLNKPELYYNYFKLVNRIPDKIVYIDFGRDEYSSIHCDDWKFNDFVNAGYEEKSEFENEVFIVGEYDLINQSAAIETMEDYYSKLK